MGRVSGFGFRVLSLRAWGFAAFSVDRSDPSDRSEPVPLIPVPVPEAGEAFP